MPPTIPTTIPADKGGYRVRRRVQFHEVSALGLPEMESAVNFWIESFTEPGWTFSFRHFYTRLGGHPVLLVIAQREDLEQIDNGPATP